MTVNASHAVSFADAPVGCTLPAIEPLEAFPASWLNLALAFVASASANADKVAVKDDTGALTYGELLAKSVALALVLQPRLTDAKNVGILLPASNAGAIANLAVALLGKAAVNLNPATGNDVVNYTVANSEVDRVISSSQFLEAVKLTLEVEVLAAADLFAAVDDALKARVAALLAGGVSAMMEALPGPKLSYHATATLLYTSGSTSKPKGVVLSHESILTNVQAFGQRYPTEYDAESGKAIPHVVLGALTFAHSLGYTATIWTALLRGWKIVYHANPRDIKGICKIVQEEQVSIMVTAPTLMRFYLARATKESFASVRVLLLGSEKLKAQLRADILEKLGIEALEAYGTTEMGPIITLSVAAMVTGARGNPVWGSRAGSVGLPAPGTDIALVDTKTGLLLRERDEKHQGEIWVKGRQRMDGYFQKPEATADVIVGVWYRTGDIGYVDEDGFVYITDRLSRFAKVGGEMVPMGAVEAAIRETTGGDELSVHVTVVPDEAKGERLVAFYTSLGALTAAELISTIVGGNKLSSLWLPKATDFFALEEMPVGATGKVDMQKLKARALELVV
jgi:acyl-[acyl-carrier-protein]-phospholipid O-acyltransferase/long-chain-fatty-acid--[acyl-carrier-protein] ligase